MKTQTCQANELSTVCTHTHCIRAECESRRFIPHERTCKNSRHNVEQKYRLNLYSHTSDERTSVCVCMREKIYQYYKAECIHIISLHSVTDVITNHDSTDRLVVHLFHSTNNIQRNSFIIRFFDINEKLR